MTELADMITLNCTARKATALYFEAFSDDYMLQVVRFTSSYKARLTPISPRDSKRSVPEKYVVWWRKIPHPCYPRALRKQWMKRHIYNQIYPLGAGDTVDDIERTEEETRYLNKVVEVILTDSFFRYR